MKRFHRSLVYVSRADHKKESGRRIYWTESNIFQNGKSRVTTNNFNSYLKIIHAYDIEYSDDVYNTSNVFEYS